MDRPALYKIRVQGILTDHWLNWFEGLEIRAGSNGETTLCGFFADQAALFGVLAKIHGLNLVVVSIDRTEER